jgi:hypothetical protein
MIVSKSRSPVDFGDLDVNLRDEEQAQNPFSILALIYLGILLVIELKTVSILFRSLRSICSSSSAFERF